MKNFLSFIIIVFFISFYNITANASILEVNTIAKSVIIIEANTGKILFNKNAYKIIHPASLTKLLTLYIIFDQLSKKHITLKDILTVSENAYKKGGSKTGSSTMFLKPNQKVSIEELIYGIATVSGNDACIVLSEYLAGSEELFAKYMNLYAKKLGLKNSHFTNSTGWPNSNHYSTVYDIAKIAQRIILDFPEYYKYFNVLKFTFNNITQYNQNALLFDKTLNVDGLKTGHTTKNGYSLAFSAVNSNGIRLIGVIEGLTSKKERLDESKKLLTWVFLNLGTKTIYKKGDLITSIPTWFATPSYINIYAPCDINIFYNKNYKNLENIRVDLSYINILKPNEFQKNQIIGNIMVKNLNKDNDVYSYMLTSSANIKEDIFIKKFFKTPYYLIKKYFY